MNDRIICKSNSSRVQIIHFFLLRSRRERMKIQQYYIFRIKSKFFNGFSRSSISHHACLSIHSLSSLLHATLAPATLAFFQFFTHTSSLPICLFPSFSLYLECSFPELPNASNFPQLRSLLRVIFLKRLSLTS